jgi:hypothetical protein
LIRSSQIIVLLILIIGCKKAIEQQKPTATVTDLNPVGIWDATYFKHRYYSVGARFEAPKGLFMTFFSDGTFSTYSIPHLITPENIRGKYLLNKTDKTIILSDTQWPTQPIMFVDNAFGRITGRLIFLDGTAFVAEYELVKRTQ